MANHRTRIHPQAECGFSLWILSMREIGWALGGSTKVQPVQQTWSDHFFAHHQRWMVCSANAPLSTNLALDQQMTRVAGGGSSILRDQCAQTIFNEWYPRFTTTNWVSRYWERAFSFDCHQNFALIQFVELQSTPRPSLWKKSASSSFTQCIGWLFLVPDPSTFCCRNSRPSTVLVRPRQYESNRYPRCL